MAATLLFTLTACIKEEMTTITLGAATSTESSITLSATITGSTQNIGEIGFIYGTDSGLSTAQKVKCSISGGAITATISNLDAYTKYYYKAYISTGSIEVSTNIAEIVTKQAISALTTAAVSSITGTTAVSGGNIISDGGADVTARGVCWSTSENPTINLTTKTSDGIGIGSFTSNITDLTPGTTYYVRAYATNSVGTSYGEQKSFATEDTQRAALEAFYNATGGLNWVTKTNWCTDADISTWYGVTVEKGFVTKIELKKINYQETFPTHCRH